MIFSLFRLQNALPSNLSLEPLYQLCFKITYPKWIMSMNDALGSVFLDFLEELQIELSNHNGCFYLGVL
jgi:hypothetical protein